MRVEIGKGALGSGNFGTVFRGVFAGDAAKGAQDVILKNAKADVLAAEELLECEMDLNYHVHANASPGNAAAVRWAVCCSRTAASCTTARRGGLWSGRTKAEHGGVVMLVKGSGALAAAMCCEDPTELGVTRHAMTQVLSSARVCTKSASCTGT